MVRWAPRPSLEHHGDTQDPQVAVVAVVEEWAKEWRVDSVLQLQQRPWETCQVEPMEPITAEEVWKAGSHFKEHTGVGVDLLHPKLFSTLSRPGAQAVADLLNRVEAERQWPAHQQMLIYLLILKPNGKDRPIGLLPSLIRLWETIRAP